MRRQFVHRHDNPRRAGVVQMAIEWIQQLSAVGEDFEIHVREPRRTLDANACMWATLTDIAQQVPWPHTAGGEWRIGLMSKDAWKAVLTAAFEQETQMAQGVGGGAVMLGARTSQYSRKRMGEFIEFVHAFGSEKGVKWSAKAEDELAQFAPAPQGEGCVMDTLEAKSFAVSLLRRRLNAGWRRKSIEETAHEGGIGPGNPGYFMSAGKISVPMPRTLKHGVPGTHTFKLRDLLDEIDGPQGGLFG